MTIEFIKGNPYFLSKNIRNDGRCPVCNTQIKIIKREEILYKTRLLKVRIKSGQKEIRCPKCKNFIIEI